MKKIYSILFPICFLLVAPATFAQQMKAKVYTLNHSEKIGDSEATVVVEGGKAPYRYKWSEDATPWQSNTSDGIKEGLPFSVYVIDNQNDTLHIPHPKEEKQAANAANYQIFTLTKSTRKDSFPTYSYTYSTHMDTVFHTDAETGKTDTLVTEIKDTVQTLTGYTCALYDTTTSASQIVPLIPYESISEAINKVFTPVVEHLTEILFWDPFAATGMVDPIVYVPEQHLQAPFWADTAHHLMVGSWNISEGDSVKYDQPLGALTDGETTIYLYATANGKISGLAPVGTSVRIRNQEKQRWEGATLATITNENNPQKLRTANGDPVSKGIPIIVVWLVIGAIFFTLKMRFVNFRGLKHALELIRGKYNNPKDKGEVTHFQALTTALSATVGLGNIAGVAIAVSVGGAGATFWMIVAGLLGMSSKFVECTLGVKYREIDKDGEVSGGPMYYLSKGLAKRGMSGFGKTLAIIFAILCVGGSFGGGNMFQANQAFDQVSGAFPALEGQGFWFGLILAALVGIVIIGGIKSIAKVTDKIVPFMVSIYMLFALIIIVLNIGSVGEAFSSIFAGAFDAPAIKGGVIGVLIMGFRRAAFSNEAGVGSASIAHAASKTNEPVSEGIVALLEPFIDTVLVCTMTALVLIFTGYVDNPEGLGGSTLTSQAFSSVFPWLKWVLMFAILLFAFSTMISWSYYGQKAWAYVFGHSKGVNYLYKVIFLGFIVVGSTVGLGSVLDFSDLMILGMAFPNILGLIIMSGEVKADLKDYFARIKSGAIQKFK